MSALSGTARAAASAAVGGAALSMRTASAPLEPDLRHGSLPAGST